jgi:hypothetical protein
MIFCVVADEGSSLTISQSEIKGNPSKDTIGIISRWADLNIRTTLIHKNSQGGVLVQSHKLNKVEVNIGRKGQLGELSDPRFIVLG